MESSGKQEVLVSPISPEKTNSSEENDHRQEQVKEDSATATTTPAAAAKRSYECTFCKRGFTNAQALGGHMNIHRKDRAKAKQVTTGSSNSNSNSTSPKFNQDNYNHMMMNPNFRANSSDLTNNYYPVFENPRSYTVYFPCPNRSENQPIPSSTNNEELRGEILSLRVGSTNCTEDNIEVSKEEELDLELRLGHDPN